MKNIITIILFFLIASCKPVPDLNVLHFNENIELKGDEIILEDNVTFVTSSNDRIIAFDYMTNKNFITIYNDTTHEVITRLAQYGKGENEFISALYTEFSSIDKNGNETLIMQDNINPDLFIINIDKSIEQGKCIIDDTIHLNSSKIISNIVDDSLMLCISSVNEYYLYNYKKGTKDIEFDISDDFKISGDNQRIFHNSALYNKKKDKLFMAYRHINLIRCHNRKSTKTINFAINDNLINYNELTAEDAFSLNCCYINLCSGDYIYALYADNMSLDDYYNNNNLKPVEIHIFDWEANPILKLTIREPLFSIAVNKQKNVLYGTTISGKLYKYTLPELNDKNKNSYNNEK